MPRRLAAALALALAAALACGGSGSSGVAAAPESALAAPIPGLVADRWNWVPFPDATCSDGSTTGIAVNPGSGPDLLVFLDGGGACSSGFTCFTLRTASLGPFGEAEFQAHLPAAAGTILDRQLAGNPYADATLVFVPYCTGDVHGGTRVVTYTDGPGGTVHHTGHTNVLAYLKRLAPTYPSPRRIILSGSSAGGYGALVNYDAVRAAFPGAAGVLVDDSGQPLPSNGGPLIQGGFRNWGIAEVVDSFCGPGVCESDLSKGLAALIQKYPADRFALLSWLVDPTTTAFQATTPVQFTVRLLQVTANVIAPSANARAFIAAGTSHTMLGRPEPVSQDGVPLLTWLGQQLSGDAAWRTIIPP